MLRDFKDEYWIVGVTVTTIFETAWALRGLDQMLIDMVADAELAHHLLDIPYQYHLAAAKKLVELGVDMIWTGDDVTRHLDPILSVPEVHAIQWVQGVGDDLPIMQWVPFIKEIQARGVPVVVDLNQDELDDFMAVMDPHGLFLWVATDSEEEECFLLKKVEAWT